MAFDWTGRRVLIVGGLGFVGSNLAHALVARNARVTIIDSLLRGGGGSLDNVAAIGDRIAVHIGDATDSDLLGPLVDEQEIVFSLAAQTGHAESMRLPLLDLDMNCRAQLTLLETLRAISPTARLVFTSTRQVYGRTTELPVAETQPCLPSDINGVHKLAAEHYLRLYSENYGMQSVILRLTNSFGPRMNLECGTGFVGVFLRRVLRGLPVQIFGSGEQRRDFNFVTDVVEALLLAASSEHAVGGVFNLGYPRSYSLLEFVETLQGLIDFDYQRVPFPVGSLAIDIGDYQGDYSRFQAVTGWSPQVDLEHGLEQTLQYFREVVVQ